MRWRTLLLLVLGGPLLASGPCPLGDESGPADLQVTNGASEKVRIFWIGPNDSYYVATLSAGATIGIALPLKTVSINGRLCTRWSLGARPYPRGRLVAEQPGPFCREDSWTVPDIRVPDPNGDALKSDLEDDFVIEGYPGSQWYGPDGDEIPMKAGIINVIAGPDHCGWHSAAMMHVGWPLGHAAKDSTEIRQFVADPKRVLPRESLMTRYQLAAALPEDAEFTGYRTDFMELWLDHDDDTVAYLVFDDYVERWPRAREPIACD